MYINFTSRVSIHVQLNKSDKNYFNNKYSDYISDRPKYKILAIIKYGVNCFNNKTEIIRPPIARCQKGIFIFDYNENTLFTNFENIGLKEIQVEISSKFNLDFLSNFIEFLVYLTFRLKKTTIIHASAFYINNQIVICPASRNVGKTNLLLEALKDGAQYIADDWLCCDYNGNIFEFPKSINIQAYNLNTLLQTNFQNEFVSTYKNLIKIIELIKPFDPKIKKEIFNQPSIFISQREFINSKNKIKSGSPKKIFWLRHNPDLKRNPKIKKVSSDKIKSHLKATKANEHYIFLQALNINSSISGIKHPIMEIDVDKNLNKILSKCKFKYLVDVPSQYSSNLVFKLIKKYINIYE